MVCSLCFVFFFFFLILHGVYVVGIMGFIWWGVLFCCLCTTTSLYIPYGPFNVYSYIFCYVLCAYFFIHMSPLVFLLVHLYVFCSHLDENFWGVHMHMHHMQLYMCLEICMLNILCYNLIPLARIVMLSM